MVTTCFYDGVLQKRLFCNKMNEELECTIGSLYIPLYTYISVTLVC